jgi:hypothetical protein
MLPVPRDWSVEAVPPTNWYQHCLPETFRYLNLVTDTDSEINALFNNSRPATTDHWETTHLQSMTGEWDHNSDLFKSAGFNTVIDAETISDLNGNKPFDHTFGYFDEGKFLMSA